MDINVVIQQLKNNAPVFCGNVAGAAELQLVLNQNPTTTYPWAYCFPLGSVANPNTSNNGLDQTVTETFAVVVILDNSKSSSDRRGQGSAAFYELVRSQLWQSLLAPFVLTPSRASRGVEYVGDELIQQDLKRAIYEFKFSQTILITDQDGFQGVSDPLLEISVNLTPATIEAITPPNIPTTQYSIDVVGTVLTAGAPISGHTVLMSDGNGRVIQADPTNPNYSFAGISQSAFPIGAPVYVIVDGPLMDAGWNWPVGVPLFVGASGSITAVPPQSGILQQIATSISPTEIYVKPYAPISLD